jgi:hypothetical protein
MLCSNCPATVIVDIIGGSPSITVNVGSDLDASTRGVPEPATWALMLIGVGGIGGVMRRRHRLGAAAA